MVPTIVMRTPTDLRAVFSFDPQNGDDLTIDAGVSADSKSGRPGLHRQRRRMVNKTPANRV